MWTAGMATFTRWQFLFLNPQLVSSLSLKVSTYGREIHILSILAFSSAPPLTRVAPATKISASKRKSTVLFGVQFSTNWLFQNLPKSSARFRCVTSFALASLRFPSRAIVTSLRDTSALHARAWTPVLKLHLSNPCTEPKGSQPNKTQRHDRKSLGHYITFVGCLMSKPSF